MVVTETEFLLVDPDKTKLGWGVVHFIGFLQVITNLTTLHIIISLEGSSVYHSPLTKTPPPPFHTPTHTHT